MAGDTPLFFNFGHLLFSLPVKKMPRREFSLCRSTDMLGIKMSSVPDADMAAKMGRSDRGSIAEF